MSDERANETPPRSHLTPEPAAEMVAGVAADLRHMYAVGTLSDHDKGITARCIKRLERHLPTTWEGMRQESIMVDRYARVVMKLLGAMPADYRESVLHDPGAEHDDPAWKEVRDTIAEARLLDVQQAEFDKALGEVLTALAGKPVAEQPPAPEPPKFVVTAELNLDPDHRTHSPFTAEQVKSFNAFQKQGAGFFHPFTCTGDRGDEAHRAAALEHHLPDGGVLLAKPDGSCLYCPACGYTQEWAHGMMTDGSWRTVKAAWERDLAAIKGH